MTAALASLGVLHTLSFLVQEHVGNGALVLLFSDWRTEPRSIHAVYPPHCHLSNKVQVFVDWSAELFARHDLIQRKSTLPHSLCHAWAAAPALPANTEARNAAPQPEKKD